MKPKTPRALRHYAALLFALLTTALPTLATAHSNGSGTEGCSGCHFGGKEPTVLITPDLTSVSPGQRVILTVSISATNGDAAGFCLKATVGSLSIVDSGTKFSGNGVTHTAARAASGDPITFQVGWTAPAEPGGVDFSAWGNSVNGDRSSRGDADSSAFYSLAFGCTGDKFFRDYDGDGVGAESSGYTMACSAPQSYSAKLGDCNDSDPKILPGRVEACDGKDNDCNGQTDEGLAIDSYCADADSDGHGATGAAIISGCGPSKGFGLCDDDCNDEDPSIYPGAPEICNAKDDNCNDRVDEDARVICGLGWCSQYAVGCTSICTPGSPRVEECNDFDDDCDGVKDNGTDLELCGKTGLLCKEGYCIGTGAGGMSNGEGANGSAASPSQPSPGGGASKPSSASGCSFGSGAAPMHWASAVALSAVVLFFRHRRRQPHKFGPR